MESEFLDFTISPSTGKTKIVSVTSKKGALLGYIKWYGAWRKYCFFIDGNFGVIVDVKCMKDIIAYIDSLMEERKQK